MVDYLKKFIDGETIQANDTNDNNDYILDKITDTASTLNTRISTINSNVQTVINSFYPVGAIYLSVTATCPLEGVIGHWEKVSSGRVLQGADDTHAVDTTIPAGLPNITGSIEAYNDYQDLASGAFYAQRTGAVAKGDTTYTGGYFHFDASRSSSIYGNSSTVQPPAYVVNIWKRVS